MQFQGHSLSAVRAIYKLKSDVEQVAFVHLIDGEVSSLENTERDQGRILSFINEFFRKELLFWHVWRDTRAAPEDAGRVSKAGSWVKALQQRKEQFFVRISSNRPIGEFWNTSVVKGFFKLLPVQLVTITPTPEVTDEHQ